MKLRGIGLSLAAVAGIAICSCVAQAQSAAGAGASSSASSSTAMQTQPGTTYVRPSEKQKITNFAFDAFGPYPFVGAAVVGGVEQAYNTPPEWGQGMDAYGVRVASVYGNRPHHHDRALRAGRSVPGKIQFIITPANAREFFSRLEHALISTVTSRRGEDGHRMISFPAIAAPYGGTMTAALGWYPSRFGPKDGFRMGNYNLLGQAAQNVATEFIFGGPHALLSHMNMHGMGRHNDISN